LPKRTNFLTAVSKVLVISVTLREFLLLPSLMMDNHSAGALKQQHKSLLSLGLGLDGCLSK